MIFIKTLPRGEMKINLGCLGTKFKGFKNVDLDPGQKPDILTDMADLSMIKSGSVTEMIASHVLEHKRHTETEAILREWYRVLKPGATLWLMVPDFDAIVKVYIKSGMMYDWLRFVLYGDQTSEFNHHYITFTYPNLRNILHNIGFTDVERFRRFKYSDNGAWNTVDATYGISISLNLKVMK